jgi:hypothetical protein
MGFYDSLDWVRLEIIFFAAYLFAAAVTLAVICWLSCERRAVASLGKGVVANAQLLAASLIIFCGARAVALVSTHCFEGRCVTLCVMNE